VRSFQVAPRAVRPCNWTCGWFTVLARSGLKVPVADRRASRGTNCSER
jgi:hypothetical protein